MAQVDYFLKIDGIDGESQDDKHKNEIHILSHSHGALNSGTAGIGGGLGAGKVQMQDFHFTAYNGKHSPKLWLACSNGQHIKKIVFSGRKAGTSPMDYVVWTLTDCLVSSFQTGGSGHGDVLPTDQFSINFTQAEYAYSEQKSDGSKGPTTKTGWNVATNKPAS